MQHTLSRVHIRLFLMQLFLSSGRPSLISRRTLSAVLTQTCFLCSCVRAVGVHHTHSEEHAHHRSHHRHALAQYGAFFSLEHLDGVCRGTGGICFASRVCVFVCFCECVCVCANAVLQTALENISSLRRFAVFGLLVNWCCAAGGVH